MQGETEWGREEVELRGNGREGGGERLVSEEERGDV